MNKLISDLKNARQELISIIDKVPENRRNTKFLGTWSLKNIVAHLTGWSEHQIDTLKSHSKWEVPSRGREVNLMTIQSDWWKKVSSRR